MGTLLTTGSVLAAFFAGGVALFAPCCIVFLAPSYLAAAVKNRRWRLLPLTFAFGAGLAVVLVPITLGLGLLAGAIARWHGPLYWGGGLLMFGLAALALSGRTWSMPAFLRAPDTSRGDSAGMFALGVFSGVASSCCAPVLAGVMTLSALSGTPLGATLLGLAYVFGMTFPLFVLALLWDRLRLGERRFAHARPVRLRLAGRVLVTNTVNVAVAVVFAVMGGFVLFLASSAQMTSGPGFQVAIGRGLSQVLGRLQSWLAPVPEPVLGLGLLLLAAGFVLATLTDRSSRRAEGPTPGSASLRAEATTSGRNSAMTRTTKTTRASAREATLAALRAKQARRRRWRAASWTAGLLAVVVAVTAMLVTSRPVSSESQRAAPAFTLTDTAGKVHRLADHRGQNVLLYFNEGAGCDACFYQMVDIEKRAEDFARLGVIVLPIAANPADEVRPDLARFGLKTPWLLDTDVAVSAAYGTVGRGMHAGLPGHGFVLIDKPGRQRWYGEYPSMFLPAEKLLAEVRDRVT